MTFISEEKCRKKLEKKAKTRKNEKERKRIQHEKKQKEGGMK